MTSVESAPYSYSRATTMRQGFAAVALLTDFLAVMLNAFASGKLYHLLVRNDPYTVGLIEVGLVTGLFFVAANVLRNEYTIQRYLSLRDHGDSVFKLWSLAFPLLLTVGFLNKSSESFSRGAMVVFFLAGVPLLLGARWILVAAIKRAALAGLVASQRIFIVGTQSAIAELLADYPPAQHGVHVVGTITIAPTEADAAANGKLVADVAAAVNRVRNLRPDSIIIVAPWDRLARSIEQLREFLNVPVDIYISSQGLLEWTSGVSLTRLGTIPLLCVARHPFTSVEILEKRLFDLIFATLALSVSLPLMLLAALLIRLETPGPIIFTQRRYGLNQQPYRIFKFRTMTTMDDGEHVPQAVANDPRVTRVGYWLRRWNIDELPQLINVLRGEMSLVGPRPHALQHNYEHESRIALYARRHNVKPGITGWAQVNGWRGETDTEDKMRRRVEHDLYYIANWSLWFDFYILLLTVFSKRSYKNAR